MGDHDREGETVAPAEPDAAVFSRVEAAWSDLRGETGAIPRRRDLDLTGIGEALPHAFLMARVAPGIARLRVAGQAVTGLLGMDPRGMPLSVFFSAAAREPLAGHVASLFDGPSLVDLPLRSPGRLGLTRKAGRLLLLPLLGDDGHVSQAVGVLGLSARPRPGRLSLEIASGPLRCERCDTAARRRRTDAPESQLPWRTTPPRPGLAEAQRPFLRLVVDND